MVKDIVGGTSINGVYCTLCGSMIIYLPETDGTHYELGTSGFLYRSNKLMYDHRTKSMWSTIKGEPVVGPLVGKGIKLDTHHVVTTTWGKWKAEHPNTRVLSLNTGHSRDYGEGVAYRDYFASDRLMFTVPKLDTRLKNKDEVFIVRHQSNEKPLAMDVRFLRKHPVHQETIDDLQFVVVTDDTAANRAYNVGSHRFERLDAAGHLVAADGSVWEVTEEALVHQKDGTMLSRMPSHRAFWFGWYSAHPETRLVK